MYKSFKQFIYKLLIPFFKISKKISWYFYLYTHNEIKLVVGAANTKFPGWFSTDIVTLDVTNENQFKKYFKKKKINKILAEHVLEHLSEDDLHLMIKNFYRYSSDDINIRIAVPDGFHCDENYINTVKPFGTGVGADDHKHLFNYKSLSKYFEEYSFKSKPLEFWDENRTFNTTYKNDDSGFIGRSFINDKRNVNGKPQYTSLIVDFIK